MRDFGSKRPSTSERDEKAAAAGPGLGKSTLTQMLPASPPVRRKIEAPVMPTGARRRTDELFGGAQRVAVDEPSQPVQRNTRGIPFLQLEDLHTVAHEAAHVVQRRASVQLFGVEQMGPQSMPSSAPPLSAGLVPGRDRLDPDRPGAPLRAVQRKAVPAADADPGQVHDAAARGIATAASALPFFDVVQRAFGWHDLTGVKSHAGGDAAASARAMGAAAYATGDHVVLGAGADLQTVAHEAAHVVQQRGGVQLAGGVGEVGDGYEQHADAVADAVVRGESAERLLDGVTAGAADRRAPPCGAGASPAIQQRKLQLPGRGEIETKEYSRQQLQMLAWQYRTLHKGISAEIRQAIEDEDFDKDASDGMEKRVETVSSTVIRNKDDVNSVLDQCEMTGLGEYVQHVLNTYPPQDYMYISLGGSPALLTGLMQLAIESAVVIDLPISDVGMLELKALEKAGWDNLLAFVAKTFAGRERARERIVIIDMVQHGRAVVLARALLQKYFESCKKISIFSLVPVEESDLKDNRYLNLEDIDQVGPQKLTEEQRYFSLKIMACKYKSEQLLKKYDKHNMYKISTGEISAPQKDVAMACWLFYTLREIIQWLVEKQHFSTPVSSSSENIDDFMGIARKEVARLESSIELPPPTGAPVRKGKPARKGKRKATRDDMHESLGGIGVEVDDTARDREIEDSQAIPTANLLAVGIKLWLEITSRVDKEAIEYLVLSIAEDTQITIDNLSQYTEVRACFATDHAKVYSALLGKIERSSLSRQDKTQYAGFFERLLRTG